MITITIEKAEQDLTRLIDQARSGEDVVIMRGELPVARLVGVKAHSQQRTLGRLKGQIQLPDSFYFDPLPEHEQELWSGEGENGS